MSIIENASSMGVVVPKGLLDTLRRLRKRSEGVAGLEEEEETVEKNDESKEG
jgi:hypothetical protein